MSVALRAIGAAALLFGIAACGGGATYSADIAQTTSPDPGTVNVGFAVTNTGDASGSPTCTVRVSNASGSYHGREVGTGHSLEPGESLKANINVPVNDNGAQFVTDAEIHCT